MQHVRRPCRLPSAHMVNFMEFLDNLDTVTPGAVAGRYSVHQPPCLPFCRIRAYIYIYIYNWRQTPRKVPLVRPSVKPPGFMPCCAGSFNRSLDVELGSLGISVVDPQRPHVSTALLYSSHLPTPCFLTIYSPFLYHIYSFFLSSLTV